MISNCGAKSTMYTLDGEPPTIASAMYSSPITISATTTLKAICATVGAYQTNTQTSSTGTNCFTATGVAPCSSSGGVVGTPASVTFSIPGGGAPAFESLTTQTTSSTQTQALYVFQYGGTLDPGAATCDTCTEEAQDITIAPTAGSAIILENEFDMPQFDHTHGINRQNGFQCNQQSGTQEIQVDSGNAGGWTSSTVACNFAANVKQHIVARVHWIIGDTGCGGNGCAYYDFIGLNSTYTTLGGDYSGTQGYNTTTDRAWGRQDQIGVASTSGTAITGGRNVYSATVALGVYGSESATTSGTYTISAAATPVLGPWAATNQVGDTAWYPASPVLNFQYQSPNTASMAVPISVSNCSNSYNPECSGTGSMNVTSMAITGTNASDFALAGTTTGAVASGSYLSPTVTFTPTAASGTAESATLTVNYSGATVSSQTMTLQGTSQTMTLLSTSACPTALASGTKYQLSANITCATTDFTEATNTNTYLNLAGHTLTYCNTPSSSLAAAVLMNGNSQGLHVYGGTITEPTGNLCTGTTAGSSYHYGSGWVINSSDGSTSGSFGTQLSLLTGNLNDAAGKVLFEEKGNATTALSTSVTMVNFVDNSAYDCASVACRAGNQDYPILDYDAVNSAASTFEMIGGVGGTQGGTSSSSPHAVWEYNTLNPGSTTYTTSNGFAIQDWATGATVAYNQIFTNISTPCTSCRGIQIGSIVEAVTGSQIHDNYVLVTQLANNPEYGGCQGGGGYGIQLNTAGSGLDLSNNIIEHNTVIVTDGACAGPAFSFSNATNTNGPNQSISNHYEADLASSTSGIYPVQGMQFLAYEYSPAPNGSFVSTGDTILGDTSALNIAFDGTTTWTCTNCTFGKGTHPVASGWLLYDYYNGLASGNVGNGSGLFSIINPTFNAGASKALNNLSTWAHNNTASGMTGSYIIQWPYQVTVTGGSSGSPIVGATVTVTDTDSTVECTATTNSSGVATCATLNDTLYKALSGTYTATSYNPMGFAITKSGCTTATFSETITGSIVDTRTLGGC